MRNLLLVDLDNVAGMFDDQGNSLWELASLRRPRWGHGAIKLRWHDDLANFPAACTTLGAAADGVAAVADPTDPDVVVIVAMNVTTQQRLRVTADQVSRFATAAARALNLAQPEQTVARELCLTLNMPEAVDMALFRLLSEAPCHHHRGPFERVVLWSHDRGLRAAFAHQLPTWLATIHGDANNIAAWTLPDNAPWQRGFAPPTQQAIHHDELRPTLPQAWSASVVAGTLASALQTPLRPLTSLTAMTNAIGYQPHVLSQIGLTAQSVRGVARLDERLAGQTHLSANSLGEDEGVELTTTAARSPLYGAVHCLAPVEEASVGNGAARFPGLSATLATKLQATIIGKIPPRSLAEQLLGGERLSRFSDSEIMNQLPDTDPLGDPTQVTLKRRGDRANRRLQAKVESARPAHGPTQWWVYRAQHQHVARGGLEVMGEPGPLAAGEVRAIGCSQGRDLVLRSPIEGAQVYATAIRCGEIEHVTTVQGAQAVALLETRLAPSPGHIDVIPIQRATRPAHGAPNITETRWRALRRLPLVVPREAAYQIPQAQDVYEYTDA